jgi:hypothetical protein
MYQIGLVDSIKETYGEEMFDFYSYYPQDLIESAGVKGFPSTPLGEVFSEFRKNLFDRPIHDIESVLKEISLRKYHRLYLKARFRNLSALSKKWKDARDFEQMIEFAVEAGYKKDERCTNRYTKGLVAARPRDRSVSVIISESATSVNCESTEYDYGAMELYLVLMVK